MDPSPLPSQEEQRRLMQLMTAYQNGDLRAFEQLYATLVQPLRHYFRHCDRDRGVADDLVQETFLEIHRSRRTYTPPLPVRPWVFGVARNVLARRRRAAASSQEQQRAELNGDDADVLPATLIADTPVSDTIDMQHALAGLPASSRDAWLLHHLFGHSFDTIAQRLGITVMAAKLRSSRATRALRRMLSNDPKEKQ